MAMTDRDKKVLAAVLVLVVLGAFWFLVLGSKRNAVAEAEQAKTDAQTQLETAQQAAAAAQVVKEAKPEPYAKLIKLGAAIPATDDFTGVMIQMNDIADKANVQFQDLAMVLGAGDGGATEGVGGSSCDVTPEAGATPPPAAGEDPTGAGGPAAGTTGEVGSTAETFVGKSRDRAEDATEKANARIAATQAACAAAPTLADLSAQAAGLKMYNLNLTFKGSFFNLDSMFGQLLGMVSKRNGKLNVSGRLLDIRSINLTIAEFPLLSASVVMTGYSIDTAAAAAPAAPAAPEGTPAATTTPPAG